MEVYGRFVFVSEEEGKTLIMTGDKRNRKDLFHPDKLHIYFISENASSDYLFSDSTIMQRLDDILTLLHLNTLNG